MRYYYNLENINFVVKFLVTNEIINLKNQLPIIIIIIIIIMSMGS